MSELLLSVSHTSLIKQTATTQFRDRLTSNLLSIIWEKTHSTHHCKHLGRNCSMQRYLEPTITLQMDYDMHGHIYKTFPSCCYTNPSYYWCLQIPTHARHLKSRILPWRIYTQAGHRLNHHWIRESSHDHLRRSDWRVTSSRPLKTQFLGIMAEDNSCSIWLPTRQHWISREWPLP